MYLAYTYYIRNKITNQFYYGSRYKNIQLKRTPQEDLWIYYFTSSKNVKKLIKEYGEDSFEFSILMEDTDYDKCYFYEQELISIWLGNSGCLNRYCRKTNRFIRSSETSAETRAKLSAANKGRTPPNKGKTNKRGPMSEEQKKKISDSKKGKPVSAEHRAKISKTLKGIPKSEATRAKMQGRISPMKGKESPLRGVSPSNDAKRKMSESAKLRWGKKKTPVS